MRANEDEKTDRDCHSPQGSGWEIRQSPLIKKEFTFRIRVLSLVLVLLCLFVGVILKELVG